MTTTLIVLCGWVLLSVATVAAIARAAMQRDRGQEREQDLDEASRRRSARADVPGIRDRDAGPAGVLAWTENDTTVVVHVCEGCGHTAHLVLEPRHAS